MTPRPPGVGAQRVSRPARSARAILLTRLPTGSLLTKSLVTRSLADGPNAFRQPPPGASAPRRLQARREWWRCRAPSRPRRASADRQEPDPRSLRVWDGDARCTDRRGPAPASALQVPWNGPTERCAAGRPDPGLGVQGGVRRSAHLAQPRTAEAARVGRRARWRRHVDRVDRRGYARNGHTRTGQAPGRMRGPSGVCIAGAVDRRPTRGAPHAPNGRAGGGITARRDRAGVQAGQTCRSRPSGCASCAGKRRACTLGAPRGARVTWARVRMSVTPLGGSSQASSLPRAPARYRECAPFPASRLSSRLGAGRGSLDTTCVTPVSKPSQPRGGDPVS